jgi:hypothetical protein
MAEDRTYWILHGAAPKVLDLLLGKYVSLYNTLYLRFGDVPCLKLENVQFTVDTVQVP